MTTFRSVVLLHIIFPRVTHDDALEEFQNLVISAGADIAHCEEALCREPSPKYLIGSGKAETLKQIVAATNVSLLIVSHDLSPAQERNLERLCCCRVLSRTGLILDIFAQRARTFEGKIQVELAQLQHLSTRLVRGWSHLERQKGGIGLRGPGETQIETDRRLLRDQIKSLTRRLNKVRQQRALGRRARQRAAIPTIALVGYTNAGKSTLFNALSGADVEAVDQLFATLDPTLRRFQLPQAQTAILADTVGFIRQLPHELVAAFHATLEEVQLADLLLLVVDASSPQKEEQVDQVLSVLKAIGADAVPLLPVYNKIDALLEQPAKIQRDSTGGLQRVWVSAGKKKGLDELREAIAETLYGPSIEQTVKLVATQGAMRAELYRRDVVMNEEIDEEGNWLLRVRMPEADFASVLKSR